MRELLLRKRARRLSGFKMPEMESVETVGANSRGAKMSKFTIKRNTCGPDDVTIDIKYDIFMYRDGLNDEFTQPCTNRYDQG